MWRFLKFLLTSALVIAVAALGYGVLDQAAIPGAGGIANGIATAAAGVVIGLLVAWLRGIPWSQLPTRFRIWRGHFATQLAWTAAGCISVAVLLYY